MNAVTSFVLLRTHGHRFDGHGEVVAVAVEDPAPCERVIEAVPLVPGEAYEMQLWVNGAKTETHRYVYTATGVPDPVRSVSIVHPAVLAAA